MAKGTETVGAPKLELRITAPPAAVESATTAHVPFLTGAFEAYKTTSLLAA